MRWQTRIPSRAELVRVRYPRDPAGLRGRLGDGHFAVWGETAVLHVLWHGEAERVIAGGGAQASMWPAEGAGGPWDASLRVRGLDDAVARRARPVLLAALAAGRARLAALAGGVSGRGRRSGGATR